MTTAEVDLDPAADAATDAVLVGDTTSRYLTFALAGQTYAMGIADVTEIIEYRTVTTVPMMPPFIRGVLNLRGRVVPVVDLAGRFGQGTTQVARRTAIIIVETAASAPDEENSVPQIGVLVDAVNKIVHLGARDLEPAPPFGAGIRSDFVSGMAKWEGDFIAVLDIGRVLAIDELVHIGRAPADPVSAEA